MANKKINELSSRTPSLTDLALIGDPTNGYAYQCTISALQGLFFNVQVTTVFGRSGNVVAAEGDYTLTQLGDVTITTPANGQALVYNGTTWVNATPVNIYTTNGTLTGNRVITMGSNTLLFTGPGGRSNLFIDASGQVGIGTSSPTAALDVVGDIKMTGTFTTTGSTVTNGQNNYGQQYNESYSTNFTNGEYATFIYRKYTPTTLRNNLNTYNTRFLLHYDLTSASYTGGSGYNATMIQSQMTISGNATTKATQPFTGFSSTLFTPSATAAMNISEFTHFRMRLIDAGVSGSVIDTVYGLFIAQQKGITNYTITNGWGIYQEGSSDNNYFNGKVLIGTNSVGASPVRISGLPTSATGLSTGDLWNDLGTIKIK